MLLGRLESYLEPWDEVRILNRSAQVGDCPVAAAALVRRGESAGIYLLQYDSTFRERREEAELAAMAVPAERPRTHREELFAPEDVRPNLPVEQLASISFGGVAYPVETDNCREVAEDWQAILTVTYLLRAGWDMGDLADCPTEGLYLSVYWLEGKFSTLPEPEGPLTLVPQDRTTSGLAAVDLTLSLGACSPTPLNLPNGPTVYVTGVSLHDPWKHQEEVFSHPKILAQFTPEQLAESRAAAEKELAGRCPRGMAYPVVHYEAEGASASTATPSPGWMRPCPGQKTAFGTDLP